MLSGMGSDGLKIRAEIDRESVRGLLLANGGGAVALLALLPVVLANNTPLARFVLIGLLTFHSGIFLAVLHNRLRRICSMVWERHEYNPPPGRLLRIPRTNYYLLRFREPTVCALSWLCMSLSLAAFLLGGIVVFVGGWLSL